MLSSVLSIFVTALTMLLIERGQQSLREMALRAAVVRRPVAKPAERLR
jgi:hypothetical protein